MTLVLPVADAQLIIGQEAAHKRLEITINNDGSAHILHEVRRSETPVTMISVDGQYENIVMTDTSGNEVNHAISKNAAGFGVTIFSAPTNTIVEYDLINAITTVGAYETFDYYYLETTLFVLPDSAERVYINGGSVNLEDSKKIKCHGCELVIEYTTLENTFEYVAELDGINHNIGVTTVAVPQSGGFDSESNAIRVELDVDEHAYVDITIPQALLKPSYEAYHEGQRLAARITSQNSTHAEFQLRMPGTGTLDIFGNSTDTNVEKLKPTRSDDTALMIIAIAVIAIGVAGIGISIFVWKHRRNTT